MQNSPRITAEPEKSSVSHAYTDNDVADANLKGVGFWKIDKAGDFGWGVFALKDYQPNEFIFRGKSIAIQPRDSHTV